MDDCSRSTFYVPEKSQLTFLVVSFVPNDQNTNPSQPQPGSQTPRADLSQGQPVKTHFGMKKKPSDAPNSKLI